MVRRMTEADRLHRTKVQQKKQRKVMRRRAVLKERKKNGVSIAVSNDSVMLERKELPLPPNVILIGSVEPGMVPVFDGADWTERNQVRGFAGRRA